MRYTSYPIICTCLAIIFSQLFNGQLFSQNDFWLEGAECGTTYSHHSLPLIEDNDRDLKVLSDTVVIPTVVHIVHNYRGANITNEEVISFLQRANQHFLLRRETFDLTPTVFKELADSFHIEFRLAKIDPEGNCTDGIERIHSPFTDMHVEATSFTSSFPQDSIVQLSFWPNDQYLNIYVIQTMFDRLQESYYSGVGEFPIPVGDDEANEQDCIILSSSTFLSPDRDVFTHEVGHWLGRLHTWEYGCNNSESDGITDTPSQGQPSRKCHEDFPYVTCDNGPNGNMYCNFMDYGSCRSMFTIEQIERMKAVLQYSGYYRQYLHADTNLVKTGTVSPYNYYSGCASAPTASFKISADDGYFRSPDHNTTEAFFSCQEGVTLKFWNNSSFNTTETQWIFSGGDITQSSEANPIVFFAEGGIFEISLLAQNEYGTDTLTRQVQIRDFTNDEVYTTDNNFLEDFNDYQSFDEFAWQTSYFGAHWEISQEFGYNNSACLFFNGDNRRDGGICHLRTPRYDFSSEEAGELRFKIAMDKDISDSPYLAVYYSIGCFGEPQYIDNFTLNQNYSVDADHPYYPASNEDWKNWTLLLPAELMGEEEVYFHFIFVYRNYDKNIFIDDLTFAPLVTSTEEARQIAATIKVYPVPTRSSFTIGAQAQIDEVSLLDIRGKVVKTITINQLQGEIEVSELPAGLYFLRIRLGDQVIVRKVIKSGA